MPLYRFKDTDIFNNQIKTYPKCNFFIYDRKIYYNNRSQLSGNHVSNIGHMDPGSISLYEENIDRQVGQLIYPFIVKDSDLTAFKTIATQDYHTDFSYGDILTGSYPLTASISKERYAVGSDHVYIDALQNVLDNYKILSPHYAYNSSLGNKSTQELGILSVPSIFYGSSIRKGSIDCKFYISGSLIGRLQDIRKNGELIQTEPSGSTGSGSIAGVALYNEGFLILTGAWNITETHTEEYIPAIAATFPKWIYFGTQGSTGHNENLPSSSFAFDFEGVNYINTLTMFCHARRGELNFSNNPTWIDRGQNILPLTSSLEYIEPKDITIKNIVYSRYEDPTGSFSKITYLDKILIYDEYKNLIAIAKLASPIRKREMDDLVVKIKLDI